MDQYGVFQFSFGLEFKRYNFLSDVRYVQTATAEGFRKVHKS